MTPNDLKLIDELLCVLKDSRNETWEELERSGFTARQAMERLRMAWCSHEMPVITLSLASYLVRDKALNGVAVEKGRA